MSAENSFKIPYGVQLHSYGDVYIPLSSASDVYSSYRDAVKELCSSIDYNTVLVIAGDFNQPSIDWDNMTGCTLSLSSQILLDMIYFLQLEQQNKFKNARGVKNLITESISQQNLRTRSRISYSLLLKSQFVTPKNTL